MQCEAGGKMPKVLGYGSASFDPKAAGFKDGVIKHPEVIAEATKQLFDKDFKGELTTRRAAMALPSYRSFSRAMQLPHLTGNDLRQAVELEMEQYIPVPLKDLYLDYTVTRRSANEIELFAVGVPREVVDSYLGLAQTMGMEPVLIETTMAAASRLFGLDKNSDVASVIIDFGSLTADIGIYNKTTLVTGTVPAGGMVFTQLIKEKLKVSEAEAGYIKTRYGLSKSKKQEVIVSALKPTLQKIIAEIRRMSRYYEERYGSTNTISQVVILGGGSNMPGLGDYITETLRIPTRTYNPWNLIDYGKLELPPAPDRLMYATVAGLSMVDPKEIFQS